MNMLKQSTRCGGLISYSLAVPALKIIYKSLDEFALFIPNVRSSTQIVLHFIVIFLFDMQVPRRLLNLWHVWHVEFHNEFQTWIWRQLAVFRMIIV